MEIIHFVNIHFYVLHFLKLRYICVAFLVNILWLIIVEGGENEKWKKVNILFTIK